MSRKRFTPEQIITMLREAEVLLNQAIPVAEACRKLVISDDPPIDSFVKQSYRLEV